MGLEHRLTDRLEWERFLQHKIDGGHLSKSDEKALRAYIDAEGYRLPAECVLSGEGFAPPIKSVLSKKGTSKKRIVYTYPEAENNLLKLLTYLLQKKYDVLFADNLYSFRPRYGVHDAVRRLIRRPDIGEMWSYKLDISNYFNSIPVERMIAVLRENLTDEPIIGRFLEALLLQPDVLDKGERHSEEKGIMAGTPISTFLANLYLAKLDHAFANAGILYARYSDDIILFEPDKAALDADIVWLKGRLAEEGLSVNPKKERLTAPNESWEFLGICYQNGVVDVSAVSLQKLKDKMRRKTRALKRWKDKKGIDGISAARAFVKVFHRKLFENSSDHELTWTKWYFPLINTDRSLKEIDLYRRNCIRYLATGKRTKAAYRFDYEQMKALGYISLVHEFYKDA